VRRLHDKARLIVTFDGDAYIDAKNITKAKFGDLTDRIRMCTIRRL
jgi:hypothetical protein